MSTESDLCPFCGAEEIELVSPWGGQLITSLVRCRACNTHFESIRDAFDAPARHPPGADSPPIG
ncbi:MAG: PaaD-like zinc ribbon domain-containing protein [Solirubrobacteraceae bacterium]